MSVRKQTTKHKQDRNNKRQEATKKHKANKRTTLGTPVSQPNKKKRKTRQRTTLGTPRSSQQTNKVKNRFGFVQQAQCNKTKQQEKVNLKGPKLRKNPPPPLTYYKTRLAGTLCSSYGSTTLAPLYWIPRN